MSFKDVINQLKPKSIIKKSIGSGQLAGFESGFKSQALDRSTYYFSEEKMEVKKHIGLLKKN